jgi:hypothetical protein
MFLFRESTMRRIILHRIFKRLIWLGGVFYFPNLLPKMIDRVKDRRYVVT